MADVFISYSRQDQATAHQLGHALESCGWSVWFDSRITTGERWDEVIERELAAAKAVVVLWSIHSTKSKWVRNEARRALLSNRLVPANVGGPDLTIPVEFEGEQTADLSDWHGEESNPAFVALTSGISRVLGTASEAVAPAPPHQKRLFVTRRRIVYLLLAVMAVTFPVAAFLKLQTHPLVVLMDSELPETAYDDTVAASGRGNVELLELILKDLPISVTTKRTTFDWHQEDEIRRLDPSLIIIGSSAFYSRMTGSENTDRLLAVVDNLKDTHGQFLIYTRLAPRELEQVVRDRIPSLAARVHVWQVPGGVNASLGDRETQRELTELVTRMLNL